MLNRNTGIWRVNAALWGVSPGFESNDLGFHTTGDRGGAHVVWTLQNNTPGRLLRSRFLWIAKWYTWNGNHDLQSDGDQVSFQMRFLNYWQTTLNVSTNRWTQDDRLTRGGPSAASPGGGFVNINGSTDSRQPLWFSGFYTQNWCHCDGGGYSTGVTVNYKPSSRLTISSGPNWNRNREPAQYVTSVADPTATNTYGSRYVFGALAQTQLTLQTRLTTLLSSKVSITLFMQPLIAAGHYTRFKELAIPRTYDFVPYTPSPSFSNPDFSLGSLRMNAVFRWDLKPGSTLYAVWTRQQQDTSQPADFALRRDAAAMLSAPGDDVVLLKMAYWFGR
jgi:hypothetical protein